MKRSLVCQALLGGIVAAAPPSFASAQEHEAPARTMAETPSRPTGPTMTWARSGVRVGRFALSYLSAGVVGATSRADHALVVPVAGPWWDLTQRPGCTPDTPCNGKNTTRFLLMTDGIFQAIGALTIVGGFLTTSLETKRAKSARSGPTLDLSPTQLGAGGYGVVALGRF